MFFFLNTSNLISLITLIFLELILGIDNIVFISILSEKLPFNQREKARYTGLILALFMRIIVLLFFAFFISFETIIIKNNFFSFSIRDLILFLGGFFLLFKSIIELYERVKNLDEKKKENSIPQKFWVIVIQIVVLDAIFSIDSIITAIGMVNNIFLMIFAIIISTILMLFISKIITNFLRIHRAIIILCLSFLFIISINLILESFNIKLPKGYLYSIVIFSLCIEFLNQIATRNLLHQQSKKSIRVRVAETISNLIFRNEEKIYLQTNKNTKIEKKNHTSIFSIPKLIKPFKDEEKYMLTSVLMLADRSIRSIMTPRREISWINLNHSNNDIKHQLLDTPHNLFPVCKGELDEIIGVVRAKEFLNEIYKNSNLYTFSQKTPPIIIPDTLDPIKLLRVLRHSKGSLIIVSNEFGLILGLITPVDILETIAGEFPDADETPDIIQEKNSLLVKGATDLYTLKQVLKINQFVKNETYISLAGLLISQTGKFPIPGDKINILSFCFEIIEATKYQIKLVRVTKLNSIL
ncbi:TerC family protein [Buchnera aphidicola]|uniref:TerC family protein n=1 Tax=Buchnera aphidicola TaxID=9 RepID=UPI0031B72844